MTLDDIWRRPSDGQTPPASPPPSSTDTGSEGWSGILNHPWQTIVGGLKALDTAAGFGPAAERITGRPMPDAAAAEEQHPVASFVGGNLVAPAISTLQGLESGISSGWGDVPGKIAATAAPNSGFGQIQAASAPVATKAVQDFPLQNVGGLVAGSIPTLTALGNLYQGAVGNLANAGASISPRLGAALRLLTGESGSSGYLGTAIGEPAALATQGAGLGATQAAISPPDADQSALARIGEGARLGAIGNVIAAPATALATNLYRTLTGAAGGVKSTLAPLFQKAIDYYNIPLSLPAVAENEILRTGIRMGEKLPFSGAQSDVDAMHTGWRAALLRQAGETGDAVTPATMSAIRDRTGAVMDSTLGSTTLSQPQTGALAVELNNIRQRALAEAGFNADDAGYRTVAGHIDNLQQRLLSTNGGTQFTGEQYQQFNSHGSPFDRALHRNESPYVRNYLGEVEDAADGAFNSAMTPENAAANQAARYQYRVMKTLQPAAEEAGVSGEISPDKFRQTAIAQSRKLDPKTNTIAYQGNNELAELAEIGKYLPPLKGSPTMEKAVGLGVPALATLGYSLLGMGVPIGFGLTGAANTAMQRYLRDPDLMRRVLQSSITPTAAVTPGQAGPYATPGVTRLLQGLLGSLSRNDDGGS